MRNDFDAVVSALSVRMLNIPAAHVQQAVAHAQSLPDHSLIDSLSELGHLGVEEKRLLEELSRAFHRHESATLSGDAAEPGILAVSPLATLARFRDLADEGAAGGKRARDARRYEVRGEHGRGGMGRILAVWDRRMRRDVALKELLPADAAGRRDVNQGRIIARFLREARITGRLQHPSIIPVHEIGVRDDGTLYYTMKLVRGRTLRKAISEATTIEARMALLPHYLNLCQAIAYAHAHGVIHRDIKPSNVMIGEFGETLVIDWGLAKEIGATEAASGEVQELPDEREPELTIAGQLLGTPHYMAPEQAAGRLDQLDERADVYALGAVLYEILTGSRPYQASTGLEVLRKLTREPPQPPETLCPEAPAALVAVCRRAMEREPAARYESAAALAAEITLFQAGARVKAYEYGTAELLARFLRRHRPVVVTVALSLVVLAALGTYSYLSLRARHAAEHDLRVKSEQKSYDLSILFAQRALDEFRYHEAREALAACPVVYRDWEWGRLSQNLEDIQTIVGQVPQGIAQAALAADGHSLLAVGLDRRVTCWPFPEMNQSRSYDNGNLESWSAALRPGGEEAAVYRDTVGIIRWDIQTAHTLATWDFPGEIEGTGLAYSPDGRYLAAASKGGQLLQWDLEKGGEPQSMLIEEKTVHELGYSPDGHWLAAASDSGRIKIVDLATGRCAASIDAHMTNLQAGNLGVLSLRFSPDGATLASTGCDATAKIWEIGTWSLRHTLSGHQKKVLDCQFSPDGQTLATFSERSVKFWDTQTGAERPGWISCDQNIRRIFFHPDGRHFVTAEVDGRVIQWDLAAPRNGIFLEGHTSEVNAVRFSPDGRYLASSAGHWLSGGDSRVLIWELGSDGRPLAHGPVRTLTGDGRWINHLAFHPDGSLLSGADAECKIVTWDWQRGERVGALDIAEYTNGARCVAYSSDGTLMATAGWSDGTPELGVVHLWDGLAQQPLRELIGPAKVVDSIAFSPDGHWLAGGSRDGTVHLWDVRTGAVLRILRTSGENDWAYGVAFSPDGNRVAASCGSSTVFVWDSHTGALLHRLEGLRTRAGKVTFNPSGTRIAACDDQMVKVWNVTTGASLMTLPHGAQDVAFSPDGLTLATAGFDGRVGIWHASPWDGD